MHLEYMRDKSQHRERNKASWKQKLEKVGRKKAQKHKYEETKITKAWLSVKSYTGQDVWHMFAFGDTGFVDSKKYIFSLVSIPKHMRYSSGCTDVKSKIEGREIPLKEQTKPKYKGQLFMLAWCFPRN